MLSSPVRAHARRVKRMPNGAGRPGDEAPIEAVAAARGASAELVAQALARPGSDEPTTVALRLWCLLPPHRCGRPEAAALDAVARDLRRIAAAIGPGVDPPVHTVVGEFLPAEYPARRAPGRCEVSLAVVLRAAGRVPALAARVRARLAALGVPERR
ncbi:conserved hypothetical protein [Anaeromyxobacter dehalogenans 2CP-1]|uniref:Uncharacterized protein n=2 Tax=Anaeromyxobacter dehalogenans TaxID=161493 RepID=B8JG45_ANAD2|nr:conserved hypothetical protein [Anaeromyxobacter dehalogenans 2CP-1]